MIVVVGGTGRLGGRVVSDLVERGETVRVVARHAPVGGPGGGPGAFVAADVREPDTLEQALDGATVVVSAVHGMDPASGESPAVVDRDGNRNLISAARRAGARIVLVSVVGADRDHPMELFRMKSDAERFLRNGPMDWTVVRASAFAETWADVIRSTTNRKGVPKVFGRGQNPINFVTVDDVAAAVTRAAADPDLRGEVIEVGGPDNLTMEQFARLVTGQPAVGHIPRAALRVMGIALAPFRPGPARLIRTALVQDGVDLTFDPRGSRARHPWLPCTPVGAVLGSSPMPELQ
ncbi:nucleoside diphosphate sugar epimerase [Intrasporangium calvum DSM 43043]|uniref:Nucleoside diphosphate sugar epimerase n=2 Tax=Intrasporangium calvum TaxID=53358 RepID=E6SBR7_INTC7|nr:nucleoside diphosphate sugar epimerase [Intrasporangium calvum DSM 43043]